MRPRVRWYLAVRLLRTVNFEGPYSGRHRELCRRSQTVLRIPLYLWRTEAGRNIGSVSSDADPTFQTTAVGTLMLLTESCLALPGRYPSTRCRCMGLAMTVCRVRDHVSLTARTTMNRIVFIAAVSRGLLQMDTYDSSVKTSMLACLRPCIRHRAVKLRRRSDPTICRFRRGPGRSCPAMA